MRTTITIDDDKFDELMRMTSSSSRAQAIQTAVYEYIKIMRKNRLLALQGKLDIAGHELYQQVR